MSPSLLALLGYAAWTLVLLVGIGALRSGLTLSGQRAANSFRPDGSDVSEFSGRLSRAHANCYESLPAFAAIVLVAVVSGHRPPDRSSHPVWNAEQGRPECQPKGSPPDRDKSIPLDPITRPDYRMMSRPPDLPSDRSG